MKKVRRATIGNEKRGYRAYKSCKEILKDHFRRNKKKLLKINKGISALLAKELKLHS